MGTDDKIVEFINQELIRDQNKYIDVNISLFQSGALDSVNLLSLIAYLEKTFDIKISPSEVSIDNLDSVEKITALINKKLSS